MTNASPSTSAADLDFHFAGFHNLMPRRVHSVLLVSTLYEAFVLEEDGLINELITSEYMDMNLSHAPRVARASTEAEALRIIEDEPIDLVITMPQAGRPVMSEFAQAVKTLRPGLPVVMLTTYPVEPGQAVSETTRQGVDQVFVWNGDPMILVTIIKFIEDRLNVEHDTRKGDVRVILLIENSVRFYSAYLPLIYTEVVKLTQSLMSEGVNLMHRLLRMRARPKILLAETFEDAWALFSKYSDNLLGVVSDVRFPRDGALSDDAGLEFTRRVKQCAPLMPVLLQSSNDAHATRAAELQASFLNKHSPQLLQHLRQFLQANLGFGEFVFTMPDGREVGRAGDLRTFEEMIRTAPDECLDFHARFNHFSNWLMARTEFDMAARIRPLRVTDFDSLTHVREYLLNTLAEFHERSRSGVVAEFSVRLFDRAATFTRIGGGSLGGKGRGLAFINAMIRRYNLRSRYPGVRIAVPPTAVLGTDVLDEFLDLNHLHALVAQDVEDHRIAEAFLRARLPRLVRRDLRVFLRQVRYPLAVRSSSLLEDSVDQPFAGIYATHMIPNNHADPHVRFDQLCNAIKLVYASAFFRAAKRYIEATGHHLEEEKMAVILQQIVGSPHGDHFYPTFSGVARSYNFYPAGQMQPAEGVACVALGLGKTVVEGGQCLMFSPAHPQVLPQFATTAEMLSNSQREFFALDVGHRDTFPRAHEDASLVALGLDVAEQDGALDAIGSVYSPENDRVYDGIHRVGPRVVTFAHVLKQGVFPLAELLQQLLKVGGEAMGCPIEMEFAVDLQRTPHEFGFLQIRPIISDEEYEDVQLDPADNEHAWCFSPNALGNGRLRNLTDVIYVDPARFDSGKTPEIALEIATLNHRLAQTGRPSIMIAPGRWGSADRWLGIPVSWEQISTAKVLVETTLGDFLVSSSQGTHFFQNLTSLRVGYLAVNPSADEGHLDWDFLARQPAVEETEHVRHVRLPEPALVQLDGRNRRAAIFKPGLGLNTSDDDE